VNRSPFLLGVLVVAAGVFFTSCITVPNNPLKGVADAIRAEKGSTPSDPTAPGGKQPETMGSGLPGTASPTAAGAADALSAATRVYTDALAYLARAKADMDAKAKAKRIADEQATADRITRSGWWVFASGIVGAIIGVVCVAKNYGMGGWWVLLGGGATAILGLSLVWLGPYWVATIRIALGVSVLAFVIGAIWAWNHRKKLKALANKL
jgi:hypothetical protein